MYVYVFLYIICIYILYTYMYVFTHIMIYNIILRVGKWYSIIALCLKFTSIFMNRYDIYISNMVIRTLKFFFIKAIISYFLQTDITKEL